MEGYFGDDGVVNAKCQMPECSGSRSMPGGAWHSCCDCSGGGSMAQHRPTTARDEAIRKVADLIGNIDFAMFTTRASDGTLRSRPMSTQKVPFDGTLWFFTGASTDKVHEVEGEHQVNVAYANPKSQEYVSLSGTARIVDDRARARELWNPAYKAWFPGGVDDPDLRLIRVDVTGAEYWDSPSTAVVHLFGFAKAIATGERYEGGEHAAVDLR
jgi:general stress protein 26